jgi:hypothetical protein
MDDAEHCTSLLILSFRGGIFISMQAIKRVCLTVFPDNHTSAEPSEILKRQVHQDSQVFGSNAMSHLTLSLAYMYHTTSLCGSGRPPWN